MNGFRGTPAPERKPEARKFDVVFFASTYEGAEEYAIGDFGGDVGYVQRYELPQQNLIDGFSKELERLAQAYVDSGKSHTDDLQELQKDPPKGFVKGLQELGYTGIWFTDIFCLFGDPHAKLKKRWKVEREAGEP